MYAQYLTVALKLYGCRWCSAGSSKQPRWECLDRRILLAMDSAHVFIPQKMSRCMPPFPQKSWEIFPVTSYSAEGSKRLHVPKLFSRFSQFSRYACFLQVHWGLCEGLKTKDTHAYFFASQFEQSELWPPRFLCLQNHGKDFSFFIKDLLDKMRLWLHK